MARFLMIPHAPGGTLAHVAACSAVAGSLRGRGHEAVFAYGGSRPELLERDGFEWHRVIEAPGAMVAEWYKTADELETILSSQLGLVDRLQPAVCVTSAGLGGLTAEVAGLPVLALMHVLPGSRYGRPALRGWMLRDAARHPSRLLGHLRSRRVRPEVASVAAAIAELRRRRGLPPIDGSAPIGPDLFACTTAPFLDPARELPTNWHYVGPLDYGVARMAPASPAAGKAPRVYISQGSTGSADLLRRAVTELSGEGWAVVVSTGGLCDPAELSTIGPRVIATAIADSRSELEAADVAVIAGGHMTAMQALRSGTPTVVIPHTSQQAAGALRAERLGSGVALWPFVRPGSIARATDRILRDPAYTATASRLAQLLRAGWNGNVGAAALAETLLEHGRVGR